MFRYVLLKNKTTYWLRNHFFIINWLTPRPSYKCERKQIKLPQNQWSQQNSFGNWLPQLCALWFFLCNLYYQDIETTVKVTCSCELCWKLGQMWWQAACLLYKLFKKFPRGRILHAYHSAGSSYHSLRMKEKWWLLENTSNVIQHCLKTSSCQVPR